MGDGSVPSGQPPGPDGLPVIGTTREFASDRFGFITRMAEEYGDIVRMPVAGGDDFYVLFHPDHIRHVLVENNRQYVKGEVFQRRLGLLGQGALNAEGEEWRRQRHMVEPAFHPDRIVNYARPMDEVMTLLLAGHETTPKRSPTPCTCSRATRVWKRGRWTRLLEELDGVLGGDAPTVEDSDELAYTEEIIRESMRLYPPVWSILREPTEDDEIGGDRIPAGETVGPFQRVTHRDPRFYDDPMAFDPDCWTGSFRRDLHPFAYFPFSGGPRRCLGDRFAMQEASLVVATLLRDVHFEALRGEDLELAPAITHRGHRARFRPVW